MADKERPTKSFQDWVAEKDALKSQKVEEKAVVNSQRRAQKAALEEASKAAFAQWTKRVEAYDKAIVALQELGPDAESNDSDGTRFKNVPRALAFVDLAVMAPPLLPASPSKSGQPGQATPLRPSTASSVGAEAGNKQQSTYKAFKNFCRKHKGFETLRLPASMVKETPSAQLLRFGCPEVTPPSGGGVDTSSTVAWELSNVRYAFPPPGAALAAVTSGGAASEEDHFRNKCFDAAVKMAWDEAMAEAKEELVSAVKASLASGPGGTGAPNAGLPSSGAGAIPPLPLGGKSAGGKPAIAPGDVTLASALASPAGQRYCLEKGTRWLQARRDTLKAQAAKKKAADESEAKAMAKAKHAAWLRDKTQAKRGRSGSRGPAGGGKASEDGDDDDKALLPRMDFSMGTTGRTRIAGPVRPSSASATARRGKSRSPGADGGHSPSAEEAKGFAIWSAIKEAIATAEDCLTLLEFPSVSQARMLNGGSIPDGYPLHVTEDDKALMKTVGFACKSIHASGLFEPWTEWACQDGLFSRNQTAAAWSRFDVRSGMAENDLVGGSATSDYEHARANNLLPSTAAAAIKLLHSLCAEGKARRQHGKRAAAEKPPAAPTLVRAVHLEAPPRYVYGAAEVVAAARLHYKGGVGVAVPDGCPVLALGGTGVGAEVVLQWWLGADDSSAKDDPDGVQLPYACTLETCGIAGGKDQVEGNWTQVAMDPPDPLAILTSAPASSYVPLSVKAQGLGAEESIPAVAKPGVDTFAGHHNGSRTRMRGCIRIVGLAPNSSFCYRVRAYNRAGASTYAFMIVTTAPCAPPSPILARPSVTPLALLSPADAAEVRALKNSPAAATDSVRLVWSMEVCRRAALCRLLRVFDLAVSITNAAAIGGRDKGKEERSKGAAEGSVLLRCVSKEYGLHAFLSTALAAPDTWPSMQTAGAINDDNPPAPCSVMEALVALASSSSSTSSSNPTGRRTAASLGGDSMPAVFVTLPKLLSLFASDHAALIPYIGGGGQLQLEVVQRDAALLSLGVGAGADGQAPAGEVPSLSPAAVASLSTASVDTRYVLTKCVADRYESNAANEGSSGVEQVWEDASVGMRSVRTVGKLQPGCAYSFRVQAVNKDGIPSPPSFVGNAATLLPKPAALKSATVRGAATAPADDAGTSGDAASAAAPATMSTSLTWSFGAPPGTLPRGAPPPVSATTLPPLEGEEGPSEGEGNNSASLGDDAQSPRAAAASAASAAATSATDSHVAALLKQLQSKKAGSSAASHSTPASASAAAAAAAAGGDASESLADPSRWFSLRRLWDKAVRLGTVLETIYLSQKPSSGLSDDKIDVFQLRGLLADAGVFEECCSKPAAELATDYLRPVATSAAATTSGNAGALIGGGGRPVIDCLLGIAPSNADRVRWASLLQGLCKVPFTVILDAMVKQHRLLALAAGGSEAELALLTDGGLSLTLSDVPVPTSATVSFSTLKAWWDNWLFAGRLDAKGRPLPQADAIPVPDPSVEASWLTTCTSSFGYGVLYLVEMQEFESQSSSSSSAAASAGGSTMANTSMDGGGGLNGSLLLNSSSLNAGASQANAGASAASAVKPWRIAAVSHECRMRLSELVPHSRFRVRISALSRGAISHPTIPITVTTPPLAPFAAVPIRTTPRSVSVRWYPAEGGACKFVLQLRKVGSLIQIAAQQGHGTSVASLLNQSSSAGGAGAAGSLFHGRNMNEAVARHLAVGAAATAVGAAATSAAGPRWVEEMGSAGGATAAIGLQGSFSSSTLGSVTSGSSSAGGGWSTVYSGPQCFAVVTGLVAGMVYRLRVVAEGYNGQMSLPSVETQIITPQAVIGDGGFGPSTLLPERAADQFRVPVSLVNCAAILSSVFNQGLSVSPSLSFAEGSLSSSALHHAPDIVVGDVVVWTEPVYADLPAPIADAIAYHYMRPSNSSSSSMFNRRGSSSVLSHDAASALSGLFLDDNKQDYDNESTASTDLLSPQIIKQIADGIVKGGKEAPPIVAASAAASAAAAASGLPPPSNKGTVAALFDFSALPQPPTGMRRIFICRRTIAAAVLLDSASGVTSGSAVAKPPAGSCMPASAGSTMMKTASATSAPAGGEGGWKEEEDAPASTPAGSGVAGDVDKEARLWGNRVLTLSVEWCSVGPPEQPAGSQYPGGGDADESAALVGGGHFLGLARPYHPPIVAAVSKRFGVPAGVIMKRSSGLLGDVGPFRMEWEDEAGRWSLAEEVAASVLQREQHRHQ